MQVPVLSPGALRVPHRWCFLCDIDRLSHSRHSETLSRLCHDERHTSMSGLACSRATGFTDIDRHGRAEAAPEGSANVWSGSDGNEFTARGGSGLPGDDGHREYIIDETWYRV